MRKLAVLGVSRYDLLMVLEYAAGCLQDAKEGCAECGEKISEDHISCNNLLFHPRCMKCQVCGEQVRGEKYFTYKDRPICEKDFRVSGHLVEHIVMFHEAGGRPCMQRV